MKHSSCSRCFRSFPFVAVGCSILLIVSIPIWFTFTSSAARSTAAVLDATSLQSPDINAMLAQASTIALTTLYTTRNGAVALLVVGLAVLVLVAALDADSRLRRLKGGMDAGAGSSCRVRSYVLFSAAGTAVLWTAMLVVVLLVAFCTAWFLGAWAGSMVLERVSQVSTSAEQAAQRAVDSASLLLMQLKAAQLGVMDGAPDEVKDTDWFKDFYKSIEDMDETQVTGMIGNSAAATCQPGCIKLGVIADLAGLKDSCICITNTLTSMQQGLERTHQSLLPVLVGLLLCYLACSWLVMYCTGSYVTAKHQSDHASFGPSGIRPYTDSNSSGGSADAAIDIQNSTPTPKYATAGAPTSSHRNYDDSLSGWLGLGSANVSAGQYAATQRQPPGQHCYSNDVEMHRPDTGSRPDMSATHKPVMHYSEGAVAAENNGVSDRQCRQGSSSRNKWWAAV